MERLLNILTFRQAHTVTIGKHANLTGSVYCKPNYAANEIELVPADHYPSYPTRTNYLTEELAALAGNITSDFFDRIRECCGLFVDGAKEDVLADEIIDNIRAENLRHTPHIFFTIDFNDAYIPDEAIVDDGNQNVQNSKKDLMDYILDAFRNNELPLDEELAIANWNSILSGHYSLEIEELLRTRTKIVTYKRAHSRQVVIPTHIANKFDWNGKPVGLYTRNGKYIVKPARDVDLAFLKTAGKPTVTEGRVALGRYLYLTKRQRIQLGLDDSSIYYHNGYLMKMTIDLTKASVLTFTVATEDDIETIPTFRDALKHISRKYFYSQEQTVLVRVRNNIILPRQFAIKEQLGNEDVLPTAIYGHTLYVFGHPSECSFTGDAIIPGKHTALPVHICDNCAEYVDTVKERILDNGGITSALKSIKKELNEAIKEIDKFEGSL